MEGLKEGDEPAETLFNSAKAANTSIFTRKNIQDDFGQQEDSSEILTILLDTIADKSINDKYDTFNKLINYTQFSTQVYTGNPNDAKKCRDIIHSNSKEQKDAYSKLVDENSKKEVFFITDLHADATSKMLNLTMKDKKTLLEAYNHHSLFKTIDGTTEDPPTVVDTIKQCNLDLTTVDLTVEEKANAGPNKTIKFKNLGTKDFVLFNTNQKYFIIQLMRFGDTKITTSIDIEKSEIPANDGTTDVFRILGCICHDGKKLSSGHYTYVSFDNGKPDKFYNDSAVSGVDDTIRENLKKECYVLLFERVTKGGAKAGGGSNQPNRTNAKNETRRCRLAAANRPPPNKYTRRHNKNKDRVVPTVTVIKR